MRVGAGIAITLTACTFTPPVATDGGVVDARDAVDALDAPVSARVSMGLTGFWTFDDAAGTTSIADTSGTGMPVVLKVETSGTIFAPTFSNGTLTASMPGRVISAKNTHLAADVVTGVTLEAWVTPNSATQGSASAPVFIGGLGANIGARDVVLLQAGDKWRGLVRTTAALDGQPDLDSTSLAAVVGKTAGMTHLVLVADATQRILYVDDVPEAIGVPGAPMTWDPTYAMALFDEPQHARQWLGTLALVALYDRGLSAAEVHQNFALGPAAP